MRQIAEQSGQGLGVLTYHFPSKESVFESVVRRRAHELTARRVAAINELKEVDLEGLLDAFFRPFLDSIENGEDGWRRYAVILARITQEAQWSQLVGQLFGEPARDFIGRLRAAEPGLSQEEATRGFAHLISVMVTLFASTGLLDRLTDGQLHSDDVRQNYATSLKFVAGGIRALSSQPK